MNEKRDLVFIQHVLESANAIVNFSENISKEELISNRLKQSAIVREIEIIGEAIKNVSEDLKNKYKEVEWKKIAGTRDRVIHSYFSIDLDIVWDIIRKDIPILQEQMKRILESLQK